MGNHAHPTGIYAEVLYSGQSCASHQLHINHNYLYAYVSGRGRGNLIRVFTPSKACLSPWDRGAHKSSSSVSPCAASDVHAFSYMYAHIAVLCMHRFVHVCCHFFTFTCVASHIPPGRYRNAATMTTSLSVASQTPPGMYLEESCIVCP